ncbi:hypothetical protein PHSY_001607 [Pseudozyma hubeiensis SY62]|uniref:Uncharacterized protein n=1 Tax=Pseudozyma hubeiensis (strain SY62) TaxID=1305764 RepID=R9NYW9_PSEHS|nr:hypothetical protein PHSY_001607 [Pseudozyma hubeiensis SY62]GAC94038.1 hypothetical protein PHSY_001607 [Pseudozyma hubeiensis SY62]
MRCLTTRYWQHTSIQYSRHSNTFTKHGMLSDADASDVDRIETSNIVDFCCISRGCCGIRDVTCLAATPPHGNHTIRSIQHFQCSVQPGSIQENRPVAIQLVDDIDT